MDQRQKDKMIELKVDFLYPNILLKGDVFTESGEKDLGWRKTDS